MTVRADLFTRESLEYYQENPVDFIEDWILAPKSKADGKDYFLSEEQKILLNEIVVSKRISVSSGKGLGKTALVSFASIWFVTVFHQAKVVITAPSSKTLRSGGIPEIKKWIVGSGLRDLFDLTAERIKLIEDEAENSVIEARTASKDNPEAMAGIHADNLLCLVDEGSSVSDPIFRSLVNTLTGINNRIVVISNPTRTIGFFFDTHHNDRAKLWKTFKFSTEFSPFNSKEQTQAIEMAWGRDHTIFRCDVLGEFPKEDGDSFIGLGAVELAMNRDVVPEGDIHIGVDVARFGVDKTVLIWRHGNVVYEPVFKGKTSANEVVDMTLGLVKLIRERTGYKQTIKVKVDGGGLGSGPVDYLRLDRENNIEVVDCQFGGKGNAIYQNEASIMWGCLKDNIHLLSLPNEHDEGIKNPHAIRMLKEEIAGRRVSYDTGKIMIEPKSRFKKDIGRSPDFADALVMCMYDKRTERSVIKDFDTQNSDMVSDRFEYSSGGDVYGSVFYSQDRLVSFVRGRWVNGTLYIENEYQDDANIGYVASYILNSFPMGYSRIIGNDRCFAKNTNTDVRGQIKKHGVKLRENSRYNELGAIELLNELTSNGRFKVSSKCGNTIRQISEWKLEGGTTTLEKTYGLCYAVLNLASELKERIEKEVTGVGVMVKEYSYDKFNNSMANSAREAHVKAFM